MYWLLLEAPECRGKLRSSEALIVASYSCWKKFDRCMLATDIDAELGLITCVWDRSARWPDGPSQSGVGHGFCLIPVSGVGEAGGGIRETEGDEKIGGNGVEGTFNKDVTNDEMTFEAHKQIVKPLSKTCNLISRAKACAARKSARVCAR